MMVDGNYEFKSPMMQLTTTNRTLFWAGSVEWSEKREDDVFLWMTQLVDGNEEIKLPGGFKIEDPKQSKEVDETYAYFKGTSEMKSQKLTISQKAEVRRRQIPPEDYQGFRKAMTEARDYAKTIFRAEKGGAK